MSTSAAGSIAGDIVLTLEKGRDFVTELNDFIRIAQIFATLVVKTKAGSVLEMVWDDSLCHLSIGELPDFFAKKLKIFIDFE